MKNYILWRIKMSRRKFSNIAAVGNFTKNAVENFEENY